LKLRIFNVVRRAGIDGIRIEDINGVVFNGDSNAVNIRNHVLQINKRLRGTPFRILGDGPYMRGQYRLKRRTG